MKDAEASPWRVLAASTALNAPIGSLYAFSVFLQPLEALLGLTRADLAFVFALAAAGFGVGMMLAPSLYGVATTPLLVLACAAANALGIALAAALLVTSGNWVVGLVGFLVGLFGLPRFYLAYLGKKRMLRFTNEFPNALDVIVRGIKSGLPLNDCVRIIASEAQEPVKTEFRLIVEAQTLGMSLTDAATKLFERMPCAEANFFGIVLAIQQKTGGNLAETLANLSRVIRERRKMRDKIKAVSMEAKASAAIIGSLPPAVAGLVYVTSPGYMDALFTTDAGRMALVGCGVWMSIGILVMRKMINFEI